MSRSTDPDPLAVFCYNAGSTLEDILLLEEEELIELSKNIVGNSVLEHARVIKQWRHCRMAALVNKEVEEEMAYESLFRVSEERPKEEEEEEVVDLRAAWEKEYYLLYGKNVDESDAPMQTPAMRQEDLGEDWNQYIRRQIQEQMSEQLAEELDRRKAEILQADLFDAQHVPRTISTANSTLSDEESTWFEEVTQSGQLAISTVASDMLAIMEQGVSLFFGRPAPSQKYKSSRQK
jgi:hypothetical protein